MFLTKKQKEAIKKLNDDIAKIKYEKWELDIEISKIEQKKLEIANPNTYLKK